MSGALDALRRRYGDHTPGLMGARHNYAVLCPLIETAEGPHFLFEVRAAGLRQAGEVCFPGGRIEPRESDVDCALRETEEELSIPRGEVAVLGRSDFLCNQRNFILQPILGIISPAGMAAMQPSPTEVAEVFTVPLAFFEKTVPETYTYPLVPQIPEDFPYETFGIPRDYPWAAGNVDVPFWRYQEHVIWGMTARIIRDILHK